MELSPSDKSRVVHQFDSFCKMVLAGETQNYKKEIVKKSKREVAFSELSAAEMRRVSSVSITLEESWRFCVLGVNIDIKSEHISEALRSLKVKGRDIILMSYFLEMTDEEIENLMNLVQSTVNYHKKSNLMKMRKFIEEQKHE